jgi:prevent-host-death family protein
MDTVSVVAARRNFSALLARVADAGPRVIIERHGKPMAALISLPDLQKLQEYERLAGTAGERGLAALRRAGAVREAMLAERGGEFLPESAEVIRELREERTDELTARR